MFKIVLDLIGGGSRCTTPASLGSRKSPTNDQGVQAGGSKRDDKKTVKPIQPPGQRNNQQQRRNSRERRNSRGDGQVIIKIYTQYYLFVNNCVFLDGQKKIIGLSKESKSSKFKPFTK